MIGHQLDTPTVSSATQTVLVVEDDQAIGDFFVETIREETPYEVLLARTSVRAFEIMQGIKPNLIVLDYTLPHLNGIALYDRLKAIKALANIPVLLVSTCVPTQEAEQRNIPYLKKPFELDELLSTIDKLVS